MIPAWLSNIFIEDDLNKAYKATVADHILFTNPIFNVFTEFLL